jgi:hypothetical protein
MFAVIAEFNTDENNKWVFDQRVRSGKELPCCIYGPFETEEEANQYCEDFMPDDTDVYDVWVAEEDFPEGTTINDPEEYPSGYKELESGPFLSLVVRGESNDCSEKKSVA